MTPELPETVDDRSFLGRVVRSGQSTLVVFTAHGCLPCDLLASRLPALAADLQGTIDFVCCPVEASPRTARRYDITRIPTLVLFADTRPIASRAGLSPLPAIRRWVLETLRTRGNSEMLESDGRVVRQGVRTWARIPAVAP